MWVKCQAAGGHGRNKQRWVEGGEAVQNGCWLCPQPWLPGKPQQPGAERPRCDVMKACRWGGSQRRGQERAAPPPPTWSACVCDPRLSLSLGQGTALVPSRFEPVSALSKRTVKLLTLVLTSTCGCHGVPMVSS